MPMTTPASVLTLEEALEDHADTGHLAGDVDEGDDDRGDAPRPAGRVSLYRSPTKSGIVYLPNLRRYGASSSASST